MPGTLLTDDAESMYADRLRQHAQSVWDTIANAPQTIASVAQPAFQAASSAAQNIQPIVPSTPAIDPSAVADAQQSLLQHAQGVWDSVQNAAPSPQAAPQPTQVSPQAVDPSAVNDASQRLLQHANDTWQSIGQGLTQAAAPAQQAATAVANQVTSPATTPTTPDQTTTTPTTPASGDQFGAIDSSTAGNFARTFAPYAQYAAQKLGIDPSWVTAMAASESNYGKAAGNELFGIKALPGQAGTSMMTHEGEGGGVNMNQTFASYNSPLDAVDAYVNLLKNHYPGALNAPTLNDFVHGLKVGGYFTAGEGEYRDILSSISQRPDVQAGLQTAGAAVGSAASAVGTAASDAAQGVQQAASNALPAVSQFGDKQLTAAEAYAACGPAAAVRFAQLYGRNPTLREAVDLAKNVGWSADTGMAGLQSESKLFDDMGIPHRVVGADWQGLAKEASSGNPVTISTPGHYFTADAYNAQTGAFHVGSSGTDLRQGSEWMTPQQMEATMGPLQGGLAADNPNTPGASPLSQKPTGAPSGPIDSTVQAAQQGWQAVGGGLQSIDNAVQSAATQAGTAVSGAAQGAQQAVQGAVQGAQQAVNAAGQAVTDLGAGAQQAVSGALDTARTALQQAADTAGQGLPDVTGTLKPENIPLGGEQSPLGKIAQGQKVTPAEQLEAAPQIALGYEQSRSQAAAGIDPLRNLPGGNVIGPTVEQLTDPASWVGVGNVKGAIGVAASVAASVGAQQVAENLIPDSDPNKGVKVALVSLLGAFTGGPVGERTIAPLVDRADALVSGLGVDGASALVRRAADAAGGRVGPAVRQFVTEETGAAGRPADVAAARAGQAFTAPATAEEDTTRMYHGTGADFATVDPARVGGQDNLYGPGYYLTSSPDVAGGRIADNGRIAQFGYAQSQSPQLVRLTELQETADELRSLLSGTHAMSGDAGQVAYAQRELPVVESDIARLQTYPATGGANVRALDVPQDLNLLDVEKPLASADRQAISEALHNSSDPRDAPIAQQFDEMTAGKDATGNSAYGILANVNKTFANETLQRAGFDGISYDGGQRIPMVDANGSSIQHQATVVFPDSLDKIRNAISGTQGGVAATQFAARLGGAAAGGVAGYQTTPEDASPQERALRTAGGAVAGYAGVAAGSKVVSALSDILKPDIAGPQLEQAIKTVNESDATAPQITAALDQVRQMPGTAELAPVRQQVQQSSTDLLQAMLDAARAKGADPEKLNALEQQIAAMDPNAATRRGLGDLLTGESGGVPLTPGALRATTTLGGAAAGGAAGYATTPDDATWQERAARTLIGAGAGAGLGSAAGGLAASRSILPQQVLENLRNEGVLVDRGPSIPPPGSSERLDWLTQQGRFAPPEPPTPRGPIARAVDATKQLMLSNPATHTAYVIGNLLELLRSPAALAMGGRGDDALAGGVSVMRGIPAAADAGLSALRGMSMPTLAHGAAPTGGKFSLVYRGLGAVHAFSRTLGEYQGMAQEASRILREGGISPNDPDAATYLAAHANQIFDQGQKAGAQTVFMRPNTEAQGGNWLENMFRTYSNAKEGLLASPDLKQQGLGALMDFGIPFAGIPVQMLKIVANRLPGPSQATGAIRAIKALRAGDMPEAQRQIGQTGLESAIQLLIAKNIADGNITGADDPDHPDSVNVPGAGWVDMKDMGGWALPMRIMASWADGYAKGGQNIPAGTPGQSPAEQTVNYYGPRFAGALNASMKPLAQGVPGENLFSALASLQQGGATAAGLKLAQNAWSRLTVPGAARFAENLSDPVARDIDKKGVDGLWQGTEANWPGLSSFLPAKIDPTTGQPVPKPSSGPGIFLGAKNDVASPLTIEARRLNDAGFSVTAPKTYPTEVTVAGSKVSLSPDEQRQVAQATGATMDRLATQRLQSLEYQNATDARKALMLKAMITAADNTRVAAVQKVLGPAEWRSRIAAGRNVAGQLVNQAQMPTADDFAGFNPLSGETIGAQRALAGVR